MSKFDGILSEENQTIIHSVLYETLQDKVNEEQLINIIETVENVVYKYEKYFDKHNSEEKFFSIMMMATFFLTLIDQDELTERFLTQACNVFNNNLAVTGGERQ